MTNSRVDQRAIRLRISRFGGLTNGQRTALAQVLDPAGVEATSDGLLATVIGATLPTMPINPDGGLPLGLQGAIQNARFVGATISGPPTVGNFETGDFVISRSDGAIWVCTAYGTPGTWVANSGTGTGISGGNTGLGLPLGLAGTASNTRYVGSTNSGFPTAGTFKAGDFVIALDGTLWICILDGSPGSWRQIGSTTSSPDLLGE